MAVETRSMVQRIRRRRRKRHPPQKKLKSRMPNVRDAAKILGKALLHNQHVLKKRTPDSEIGDWGEGELQNFAIDLDKVDHISSVDYKASCWGEIYAMNVQMEYKDKPLHVNLFAFNAPGNKRIGFYESTCGKIFVTRSSEKLIAYLMSNATRLIYGGESIEDCFSN